jgi:hypothetical protein
MLTALRKEKDDLEKVEREMAQQFLQLLHTKLHDLHHDMEKSIRELGGQCFEFPNTGAHVVNMLDWIRMEVWVLPNTFTKANQNITCYEVVGILKMLMEVQ